MNAIYIIAGLAILALLAEVLNFKKILTPLVLLGLVGASVSCIIDLYGKWEASSFPEMIAPNLAVILLMTISTIFWLLSSTEYLSHEENKTDRASLVLFVLLGGCMMVSFTNFSILFLGIETLSLSLYTLAGSRKNSLSSTEASFKYFLMGSFATGFLLFGIALVYGATGSFASSASFSLLNQSDSTSLPTFFHVGIILILVGMAFKISAVPFHFWAPDVYEGSPTNITAIMATVVKIAGVFSLYSIITQFVLSSNTWLLPLQTLAVLTLLIPNIAAVLQNSAKRMLAYSSVGHVGFILLAMITLVGSYCPDCTYNEPTSKILFYLSAYSVASLMAFNAVSLVEKHTGHVSIANFKGLFKKNPFLAVAMTIALLSLAGIPPLAGFFAKYMVFVLAVEQGYVLLALLGIVTSLIGVYYYFRIIVAMYFQEPHGQPFEIETGQKIWFYVMIGVSIGLIFFVDLIFR